MQFSADLRSLYSVLVAAIISLNVAPVFAATRSYTLEISNADVAPDGFTRGAVIVNGNYRAPLLTADKGDTFAVAIENNLDDPDMHADTSIHWHGIFQQNTPWEDGPVGITQCPIPPESSYTYDFDVSNEAGTFWYHAHLGVQYCDGLRGPIVVYDPSDPHAALYDEDDENTVITLEDWFHTRAGLSGPPHTPDSTLINGVGRSATGPAIPLSIINVEQGKKYRIRLVNMACGARYVFAIQDHPLQVIEADGQSVNAFTVESLEIFAAQRYSFVIDANQAVGNYWIRAASNPTVASAPNFENGVNSAILRYAGAEEVEPSPTSFLMPDINLLTRLSELDLHPYSNPAAPGAANIDGADQSFVFPINFAGGLFTLNGVSFTMPTHPVLLQIFNGVDPADLLPAGTITYLPPNQAIQIALPVLSGIGAPHPIHLHGHAFSVIRSAGSSSYNYVDPVRRDVVSTGLVGDNVTIRFVTDNPGPWFIHCHIEWHLEVGLAAVLAEDPTTVETFTPPSDWINLCPAPELMKKRK